MKIVSYGVIDSSETIDSLITGTIGIRIYNIPYRDIGMVISGSDRSSMKVNNNDNTPDYKLVVEHLMQKFTVLPVRFRTPVNKKDILSIMENNYYDFKDNLNRLRHKVEFGLRVVWKEDEVKDWITREYKRGAYGKLKAYDPRGIKFIEDVFDKYVIEKEFKDMADIFISIVDNYLGKYASEKRFEKLKSKNLLLKALYLIDKKRQKEFKEAFDLFRIAPGNLNYTLRGPLPPFNFVEIEGMKHRDLINKL